MKVWLSGCACAAVLLCAVRVLAADPALLDSPIQRVTISATGGLPVAWHACDGPCGQAGSRERDLLAAGSGRLVWVAYDEALAVELRSLGYAISRQGADLVLQSRQPVQGRILTHRYRLDPLTGLLRMQLDLPAGAGLRLATGSAFIPEALPGFGAIYADVRPVAIDDGGRFFLDDPQPDAAEFELAWSGIRNRFWALLLRPAGSGLSPVTDAAALNEPVLTWWPAEAGSLHLDFYAGPVEWQRLRAADPVLANLLFGALWDWLRALCFGMLWLLGRLQSLVGSPGLAIILLSLSVKILMWPLTFVADRWQAQVNRTQALLQPHLDAIKREFKGEEAHNRVLAVYRQHGVHPMYTIKSLAGFLIQIPVFIAAFDMLGENFALNGASFLWIEDLAKPDRWLALPVTLPFFGGHLNLLPCLMTGFTVLASALQTDPALTDALRRAQRLRLYLMAAAFFVLFYTFPAGMVLYWTTNNVLHLGKIFWGRLTQAPPEAADGR